MNKISNRQKEIIERIQRRGESYPADRIVGFLWDILKDRPEAEPLDPRWLDIWKEKKIKVSKNVPSGIIKTIDKEMESIKVVNEEIWKIKINSDTKITFLLGAGASAPSGIPTVDKLLSELWKRARKIGRKDLDKLAKWCDGRNITNIEDLLTAAYISDFTATNRAITSLLDYFLFSRRRELEEEEEEEDYFVTRRRRALIATEIDVSSISFLQDTLQTLFGLLTGFMISASPNATHNAIVNFIKEHKNSSIITTNYDGCMDESILRNKMQLKGTIGSESEENNPDAVQLIKMHGSINWAYCDSCQVVREFDLLELKETYEKDKLSFPVIGICKNCGGLRRPLLVPPLSFKFLMFPNLVDIWSSANQSIEEADYIIVVGYSFSEADTYITKIISRSISMNKNQKMIIVNTDQKLASTLRDRFSARIDKFNEKRILEACESSEKILPDILKSMLEKKGIKRIIKSTSKS